MSKTHKFIPEQTIYGRSDGYVYFIVIDGVEPQRVKIGFTKNEPSRRLKGMQTGCPFPMRMIGFCHGTYQQEKELHDVLKDDHCSGEWFILSAYAGAVIADQLDIAK